MFFPRFGKILNVGSQQNKLFLKYMGLKIKVQLLQISTQSLRIPLLDANLLGMRRRDRRHIPKHIGRLSSKFFLGARAVANFSFCFQEMLFFYNFAFFRDTYIQNVAAKLLFVRTNFFTLLCVFSILIDQ